ncbi:MAG: hypothetical protein JRH20_11370 [Deltaproteobacteria bacterium]|nr:hypothetical protein [Deltaproteobacteria bacterium]
MGHVHARRLPSVETTIGQRRRDTRGGGDERAQMLLPLFGEDIALGEGLRAESVPILMRRPIGIRAVAGASTKPPNESFTPAVDAFEGRGEGGSVNEAPKRIVYPRR